MLDYELNNYSHIPFICGIDEAGRGPLAGPVVASCCIPDFNNMIVGVNDSKKLTKKKRENLYVEIKKTSIYTKTIFIEPAVIDRINILNATKKAMELTLKDISPLPGLVLIDAVHLELPYQSISLIKGDQLSYAIACASIIAKVERDKLMIEYAEKFPQYGFSQHKGYGTKEHIANIKKYGPCEIHRKTFIKNFM